MNIFAGKTPNERNKLIAAMVLGVMAVISLVKSLIYYIVSRFNLIGGMLITNVR